VHSRERRTSEGSEGALQEVRQEKKNMAGFLKEQEEPGHCEVARKAGWIFREVKKSIPGGDHAPLETRRTMKKHQDAARQTRV